MNQSLNLKGRSHEQSDDQRQAVRLGAIKKEIMLSIKGLRKIREACERGDVEVYDPNKID